MELEIFFLHTGVCVQYVNENFYNLLSNLCFLCVVVNGEAEVAALQEVSGVCEGEEEDAEEGELLVQEDEGGVDRSRTPGQRVDGCFIIMSCL
jgi:hypothetical protein